MPLRARTGGRNRVNRQAFQSRISGAATIAIESFCRRGKQAARTARCAPALFKTIAPRSHQTLLVDRRFACRHPPPSPRPSPAATSCHPAPSGLTPAITRLPGPCKHCCSLSTPVTRQQSVAPSLLPQPFVLHVWPVAEHFLASNCILSRSFSSA
jgi:hypothetical protein